MSRSIVQVIKFIVFMCLSTIYHIYMKNRLSGLKRKNFTLVFLVWFSPKFKFLNLQRSFVVFLMSSIHTYHVVSKFYDTPNILLLSAVLCKFTVESMLCFWIRDRPWHDRPARGFCVFCALRIYEKWHERPKLCHGMWNNSKQISTWILNCMSGINAGM